jgi:AcrR family transcriptional regulator
MPRPNQTDGQRKKLLPIVCQVFSELGYRRTTTAELADRCGVRENILYRLWPDKKAMFLAAIGHIFQERADMWKQLLADNSGVANVVERLVGYESRHQGEFGFYRIVFTALAEADDAEIRSTLKDMYRHFQQLVKRYVDESRGGKKQGFDLPAESSAWALVGLATVSNIIRELDLLGPRQRERMFAAVARHLVEENAE